MYLRYVYNLICPHFLSRLSSTDPHLVSLVASARAPPVGSPAAVASENPRKPSASRRHAAWGQYLRRVKPAQNDEGKTM